jgi:hypothetical protein
MHDLDRGAFELSNGSADQRDAYELEEEGSSAETELASELLEVRSEQELEQFLGGLVRSAAQAAGRALRSDTGRQLVEVLRDAGRRALPIVGRAIGERVNARTGAAAGAQVGRSVGRMFGLELEGLSQEDREFEVARAFVRFADAAARNAAVASPGEPATRVVRRAVQGAARTHAPGMLAATRAGTGASALRPQDSGRWVRRGDNIVIFEA